MTSTTSATQDLPAILANMSAASLFVGELLPHVNEVILYKKFAPMGTVTSVKLCRDWVTGKSLCYAYVNFENPAEAEKAYRTLNYELLEGQPMRIMKSTRNPWLHTGGDSSCCYHHHCCNSAGAGPGLGGKGLVDAKTLVEAIESYSMAFKSLALQDAGEAKAPTGYKYSSEFLKRMNNANKQYTNVFIRNFRDLLDDFKLWKLCRQFGEVVSAKVMVDEYGISKGFGFACFTDSDAAQRAVSKLNGLVLDGRSLYAGPAMTGSQRHRETSLRYDADDHRPVNEWRPTTVSPRICVRNLRDIVDDIRLRKEFERFGPVLHAELLKTQEGRSRGTGYVDFKDKADAAKALNSMNGKVIYGSRISVTYAPHTSTASTNTLPHDLILDHNDFDYNNDYPDNKHDDDNNNDDDYHNRSMGSYHHRHHLHHDASTTTNNSTNTGTTAAASVATCTSNDGDNNSSSTRNFLQLKSLASSLADKGHPININDIGHFNSTSVNRNSSNNSDINTSNNAILTLATRKANKKTAPDEQEGTTSDATTTTTTTNSSNSSNRRDNRHVRRRARYNEDEENNNDDDEADENDETMSSSATLCVKNLDESISDEKLETLFAVYGTVLSAKVISNAFGASKGFGFVIMSEAQDAVKAIKNLDGRIVVNRPIYVAPAAQARPLPKA